MKYAVAIAALFMFLAEGCDQQRPPPPASPTKAILFVTWLVAGQRPETTQTIFSSRAACEAAVAASERAGQRAKAERERLNETEKAQAIADGTKREAELRAANPNIISIGPSLENQRKLRGIEPPQVSAYCVIQ